MLNIVELLTRDMSFKKMLLRKTRNFLKSKPIKLNRFVALMSLFLIVLSWPLPVYFKNSEIQLFNVPFVYFYIILIGPALILFVTNWAVEFCDKMDRKQLETEND